MTLDVLLDEYQAWRSCIFGVDLPPLPSQRDLLGAYHGRIHAALARVGPVSHRGKTHRAREGGYTEVDVASDAPAAGGFVVEDWPDRPGMPRSRQ